MNLLLLLLLLIRGYVEVFAAIHTKTRTYIFQGWRKFVCVSADQPQLQTQPLPFPYNLLSLIPMTLLLSLAIVLSFRNSLLT